MSAQRSFKSRLKYLLPVGVKKALKYTLYSTEDLISTVRRTRDYNYPPKRLNFVGSSEFKKVGNEFAKHFANVGGLKPTDSVLDIGCGIGRMAIPLTKILNEGQYRGFDIDRRGISWCQNNITPKHPHFQFEYVDLYNKYYNKSGRIQSEEFQFPYENESFNFIFATSVFTHMLPDQVRNYLREIQRTLKPGGTAFLTFFSIDDTSQTNTTEGRSFCDFKYTHDETGCFYSHKEVPEAEIGYAEDWIRREFKQTKLTKNLTLHHGKWSGRPKFLSYQDIYITQKG